MASITVTFSHAQPDTKYDVVIGTPSTSNVGSGSILPGEQVSYDDRHGDNYWASCNGSSTDFSKGASSVNIVL